MAKGHQYTVEQAAQAAGCHPETIRRAIRRKELLASRHPTHPGRPFVVYATDLAAFLEKRRLS